MFGVLLDLVGRPVGVIVVLVGRIDRFAGDAPVLQAARPGAAVELAVVEVERVAQIAAPDLLPDALVAGDHGDAVVSPTVVGDEGR